VVLVLVYFLIGAGVCLFLGAVFGQMWNERHQSPYAAAQTAKQTRRPRNSVQNHAQPSGARHPAPARF
jgi:hypothetical protein